MEKITEIDRKVKIMFFNLKTRSFIKFQNAQIDDQEKEIDYLNFKMIVKVQNLKIYEKTTKLIPSLNSFNFSSEECLFEGIDFEASSIYTVEFSFGIVLKSFNKKSNQNSVIFKLAHHDSLNKASTLKFKCSKSLEKKTIENLSEISCYVIDSKLYLDLFLTNYNEKLTELQQNSIDNQGFWTFKDYERIRLLLEDFLKFIKHLENIKNYF